MYLALTSLVLSRHVQTFTREQMSTGKVVTHCTGCNYESGRDFDRCPNCGEADVAVRVVKQALDM